MFYGTERHGKANMNVHVYRYTAFSGVTGSGFPRLNILPSLELLFCIIHTSGAGEAGGRLQSNECIQSREIHSHCTLEEKKALEISSSQRTLMYIKQFQ